MTPACQSVKRKHRSCESIYHRHADFQSRGGSPEALYFKELPGRPLPNLHDNAGRCRASSRKIHAGAQLLGTGRSNLAIIFLGSPRYTDFRIRLVSFYQELLLRPTSLFVLLLRTPYATVWLQSSFVLQLQEVGKWHVAENFERNVDS